MKRIEVAVGVVFNNAGKVLVGQRVVKDRYFQKWEFPGGKLEAGESAQKALFREFKEETGIIISDSELLMQVEHDYPDRHVLLHVHTVHDFLGEALALEGQALKWVSVSELAELDFLQGNQVILDRLTALNAK